MSKPKFIELPMPDMGGKAFLLEEKGLFCLDTGPGNLITIACTHAGTGSLTAIDGVPDERGFFPEENMEKPLPETEEDGFTGHMEKLKQYYSRNGRIFFRMTPVVMGSWMLNAGFHNGLTIRAEGGTESSSVIATVVWMPFMRAPKNEKAA